MEFLLILTKITIVMMRMTMMIIIIRRKGTHLYSTKQTMQ